MRLASIAARCLRSGQLPADRREQCPQLGASFFRHNQPDKPLLAIHSRENGKAVIAFEQEAEQADAVGSDAEEKGAHGLSLRDVEAGRGQDAPPPAARKNQTFSEASTPPSRS